MTETDDTRHATPNDAARHEAPSDTSPDTSPVVLQIEAARIAGVSVRTIQRAIDRGALPAERQGGHCWIRLNDLDHWQVERTTPGTTPHVVVRDTEARHDTSRVVSSDTSRHVIGSQAATPDVARLQSEIADLKVERDRWHQAFERESALREEETRQLRTLIQQEQALSFSRLAAIEATTRHDATAADVTPEPSGEMTTEHVEIDTPAERVEIPIPTWRRVWRRVTRGG
jgi:excisionase family DNA binding protein